MSLKIFCELRSVVLILVLTVLKSQAKPSVWQAAQATLVKSVWSQVTQPTS